MINKYYDFKIILFISIIMIYSNILIDSDNRLFMNFRQEVILVHFITSQQPVSFFAQVRPSLGFVAIHSDQHIRYALLIGLSESNQFFDMDKLGKSNIFLDNPSQKTFSFFMIWCKSLSSREKCSQTATIQDGIHACIYSNSIHQVGFQTDAYQIAPSANQIPSLREPGNHRLESICLKTPLSISRMA